MTIIPFNMNADDAYTTYGVRFDGANDYMSRGGNLTGVSNSKKCLGSFWINMNGGNGANQAIYTSFSGANLIFSIIKTSGNKIQILGRSTPGGAAVVSLSTVSSYLSGSGWINCMFSWDASTSSAYLYTNNSSDLNLGGLTNTDVSYSSASNCAVSSTTPLGTSKIIADLADFYLTFSEASDLSNLANRAKFINQSTLKPVNLGSSGSAPTGTQPIIFFKGPALSFNTNLGTGGDFIVTGTLTDAATSPSD